MDTLSGEISRIRFAKPDTGWLVATLRTETREEHTITGAFPPSAMPREGSTLRLEGEWQNHATYGLQFKVSRSEEARPTSEDGMISFLENYLPGIGHARATEIVRKFGADTFRVIESDPGKLLGIKGITEAVAREMRATVTAHAADRDALAEMGRWNMTPRAIEKVSQYFGGATEAVNALRANPYQLARLVDGYGFKKADAIGLRMGFGASDPHRVQEGLMFAIREAAKEGHTFLRTEQWLTRAVESTVLGSVPDHVLHQETRTLSEEARVLVCGRPVCAEDFPWALPHLHDAEQTIFAALWELNVQKHPALPVGPGRDTAWEDLTLNAEQAAVIASFTGGEEPFLMLTGGAGVGKTFTIRALLDTAEANGLSCALVAPTGKAAKRMTEQTGRPASTIHRYLCWAPDAGGFTLSRVDADVLIVDETSMVDSVLMAELLSRVDPERTRVVLVGDVEQLPPVGPGQPFRDIIASGRFPVHCLTRIMRTAEDSLIPYNSQAVLRGATRELRFDGKQVAFIECEEVAEIPGMIANLCRPERLDEQGLTQADVQVLTPMRKGAIGSVELNKRLAPVFNPDGEKIKGFPGFNTGDRVIFTRNDYTAGYVNGDQGVVLGLDTRGALEISMEGGKVSVPFDKLGDVEPAYAITVHKSQGSEYPCVIVPVHRSNYIMLRRGLIYTAMTRAKLRLVLVGQKQALGIAVRTVDDAQRMTWLKELLG